MAVEERQHEKRNAILVKIAGTAALADCEFLEKPAVTTYHRGHREPQRVSLIRRPTLCSSVISVVKVVSSRSGGVHARTVFPDTVWLHPLRPAWGLRFG